MAGEEIGLRSRGSKALEVLCQLFGTHFPGLFVCVKYGLNVYVPEGIMI